MTKMKRTALLAMSVALSLAGMSYAQQVLEKVPADALVVVKVSNLAATSGKVAKLAETLGLTAFQPKLADPLAAIKEEMHISAGLKDDGEFAFVYLDPKGGDEDKSMIMLVPAADYKALIGGIEGATQDGNITVVNKNGQESFIADWGGFAAVSPNKDLVAVPPSNAIKVTGRSAKELGANDITVYANFNALREPLTKDMAKNRDEAKAKMLEELKSNGEVPEKYHPAAEAAFDQVFSIFEAFIRDTNGATIGLTITDTGIRENIVAEFKPDSYIGKAVSGLKKSDATLLTGLPAGKYFVYGGSVASPAVAGQLIDDVAGPIVKALPQDEEALKVVPEMLTDIKALVAEIQGQSFGMLVPQGGIGEGAVLQVVSRIAGNGETLLPKLRDFNQKYAAVMGDLAGEMQGIKLKQTWTDNAKTIDGINFALATNEIEGDSAEANNARQMHQLFYGSPRQETYMASTGDEVLSFMGVGEDSVKALIAASKNNEAPLAKTENFTAVSGQLPKSRIAELYIAPDEIMSYGLKAASQFGFFQGNVTLPPDLPPVGITLAGEGASLEGTAFISTDLMQALVTAGIQAASNAGGGGGRRGGGGLE